MAKISGAALYIQFGSTVLSATQRTLDVTEQQETADATAGADTYRNFVSTVKMIEASAELLMQDGTAGSALYAALIPGSQGTLIWGQEGNATGKPKKGFYATLVDTSVSYPFDDVIAMKAKFQMAGTALAFNGYTDKF